MRKHTENRYVEAVTAFSLLTALAFTCSALVMVLMGFF